MGRSAFCPRSSGMGEGSRSGEGSLPTCHSMGSEDWRLQGHHWCELWGELESHPSYQGLGSVCVPQDHFGSCCSTVEWGFAAQVYIGAGELPCFSAQASLCLEASSWFGKASWAILGSVLQPDRGLNLIRMIPSSQRGPWRGSSRVTPSHPNWAMTRELNGEAVLKTDIEAHAFSRPLPLCSSLLCPGLEIRKNSWRGVEGGTGCKEKFQGWPRSKSYLSSWASSAQHLKRLLCFGLYSSCGFPPEET